MSAIETALWARWLPYAIALLAALTLLLARGAPRPRVLWGRAALGLLAVPATGALLTYGGPLVPDQLGAPYVALVGYIALHGVVALWEQRAVRSDGALGALLGATVFASSLALLPFDRATQPTESDEPHYLVVMQSLARDRDFDVKDEYDAETYRAFYPVRLPDRHVIDVGSAQYPIHDLGLPLLGAIPFALGGRDGVLVLMCLVAAAFAWRGYALLRALAFGRGAALLAAAATALLHPLFTYTTQVYPDAILALVVLLAAERLVRPSARDLAIASAVVGTLPVLSVRAWFPAAGVALAIAAVALAPAFRGRWRDAVRPALASVLPVSAVLAAFVALEWALFRVALPNVGYLVISDQQTVVSFAPQVGLAGLLLDRTFGLLSRAPIFLVAFAGVVPLWRRARSLRSAAIAALALAFVVSNAYLATVAYWWADGSPSSRYELATLPFLLVALAAGFERLRGDLARALAALAALWTAGVTLLFALAPLLRYDIAADVRASGLSGRLWTEVGGALHDDAGTLFPSIVRGATTDLLLTLAWTAAIAALVVLGARRPHRRLT